MRDHMFWFFEAAVKNTRLGRLSKMNLFLTVLEAGNPRSRSKHGQWCLSSRSQSSCILKWWKRLGISLESLL